MLQDVYPGAVPNGTLAKPTSEVRIWILKRRLRSVKGTLFWVGYSTKRCMHRRHNKSTIPYGTPTFIKDLAVGALICQWPILQWIKIIHSIRACSNPYFKQHIFCGHAMGGNIWRPTTHHLAKSGWQSKLHSSASSLCCSHFESDAGNSMNMVPQAAWTLTQTRSPTRSKRGSNEVQRMARPGDGLSVKTCLLINTPAVGTFTS